MTLSLKKNGTKIQTKFEHNSLPKQPEENKETETQTKTQGA